MRNLLYNLRNNRIFYSLKALAARPRAICFNVTLGMAKT